MDLPRIGKPAPIFKGKAVLNNKVFDVSSADYEGKYLVLLFFPMDFAYVCPTELIAFTESIEDFAKINATVVACTTESHLSHLKWLSIPQKDGGIRGVQLPLIADKTMKITKNFGVLNEDEGIPYRAMFIIDDRGILRQITINDRPVGRDVRETRRLIRCIQHAEKLREGAPKASFTEVLPSSLTNGGKTRTFVCLEKSLARELTE